MNRHLMTAVLAVGAVAVPALTTSAQIYRVVEGFENIQPTEDPTRGWSFGAFDEIRQQDGTSNHYLYGEVDTFGVTLRTKGPDASAWVGDINYRAEGVVGFSMTTSGTADFPNSVRPMGIRLMNDNGTPDDFSDDHGFYRMTGATYPFDGSIRTFLFAVPTEHTGSDPDGWVRSVSGPNAPDFTWDDVVTNVDRLEFLYYDPEFFYIFQYHYVGVDRITAFIDLSRR